MKKLFKIVSILCLFCCVPMLLRGAESTNSVQAQQEEKKVLYLTFDDGPSEYTHELLDILLSHHMKATFFMLEAEMKAHPDVVQRMIAEGHGVGLHGVSHNKNTFYAGEMGPLKEMEQANQALEGIVGMRTSLVRTPYGSSPYLTNSQEVQLLNHQYILWDWNIDSRDWCYRNAEKTFYATIKMIKASKKEPKVILFHDIKQAVTTMKLMTKWMEDNNYTSEAITSELKPVQLSRKNHKGEK